MNLSQIEDRVVAWYMSSAKKGGASIFLESSPGMGKSSLLDTVPSKLNKYFPGKSFGGVIINGACVTLTTATGYLMPETRDGKQYSEFTRPAWWTTSEGKPLEAYDGGIIVVDEFDKMGTDEKKIFAEASLSKILGSHRLPPGWVVWFAGNRAKDRSGSTKDFDFNINRRRTFHVQPDIKSLLNWMDRNGCLPETKTFAEENPHIVFGDAPEQQGPWCTPRSLAQADGHLQSLMEAGNTDMIPTDPLTQEEIAAGIGAAAAAQLMATIKLGQELPSYDKIIAAPGTVPVPSKPDAKRLACYKLAGQVSATDMGKVLTYIKRLPSEFQIMFGKSAVLRNNKFIVNKDFTAWAASQSSLLELMAKLK